ncbi:MAG: hypothetical protein N2449_05635 [Bacteroidales bacterium]|nr:hypothetical protein [Bacteroidales bacterium]
MKSLFAILITFFSLQTFSQYLIVKDIIYDGNKKTKNFIIERELTFKRGDTLWFPYIQKHFEQSQENILKTSLFNFVTIDTVHTYKEFTTIKITVVERWYLWPIPIFEQASRNINTWLYEKDYDKINYGIFIAQANFRGRDELLRAIARMGFREQYGFAYTIPHIFQSQTTGVEIKALYFRQKQLAFKNINNKPLYVSSNNYLYSNYDVSFELTYRPKLYAIHSFEISFEKHQINDSLYILNPDFIYDSIQQISFPSFSYYFRYDRTNSVSYPTKGYFFEQIISYQGIPNSKLNIPTINIKAAYYYSFLSRIFNAHGISTSYSYLKDYGYLTHKAFGYRTAPRGYELYLIDGNAYILFQNSVRYMLIKPHVKNIYKLKNERFAKFHYAFYLSINGDLGYVQNKFSEPLTNQLLYGYGLGIDFVTYYDITLRTEFSVNQLGKKGIYFHFSTFI